MDVASQHHEVAHVALGRGGVEAVTGSLVAIPLVAVLEGGAVVTGKLRHHHLLPQHLPGAAAPLRAGQFAVSPSFLVEAHQRTARVVDDGIVCRDPCVFLAVGVMRCIVTAVKARVEHDEVREAPEMERAE